MRMCAPDRIYYEQIGPEFMLCLAGNIQTFSSMYSLRAYVHSLYPDAELVEVNDDNWQELCDAGAFDQ